MRKISLILQEILKAILLFLFYYVWLRYFTRKFWLSIVLSIVLALATYFLFFFIRRRKNNKTGLKLKEKTDAENMFLSLACADSPIDFFIKLASKKHKNIERYKQYLTISYPDEKAKTILWFENSFDSLNTTKTLNIYNKIKKHKATKIVICCKETNDKNLHSFLSSFSEKFLILDAYQTYEKLYKYYDYFPEITRKYSTEKKVVFKDFLAYSFNKKRAKGYLFSALILILSSLFLRMTIYYCIFSSLLVVFALISQFNPYFNKQISDEIL